MKRTIPYLFLVLFFFVFTWGTAKVLPDGTICVYLKNGQVDVFPGEFVKSHQETGGRLQLTLKNDSVFSYDMRDVEKLGDMPTQFAHFTSFKFNNKYNDNVFVDVFADIKDNEITASVGAIGKSLTPSFQLSDDSSEVYVDGIRQVSKVSRHRFDKPVVYTVTSPNYRKIQRVKVKDEVWDDGTPESYETEKIVLTEAMLSTNAPSNYGEDLGNLVDDDPYTFFHSTWGSGEHNKLPLSEHPYVEVNLKEAVDKFFFEYTTSHTHDNRFPYEFVVQKSADGTSWEDVQTINEGLPTSGLGVDFKSPLVDLKGKCKHLRFVLTRASYKNYLVLSRFEMKKVVRTEEAIPPHIVTPAQYSYQLQPFGRDIPVKINWLTDQANNVPRIDINIDGGQTVVDKNVYLGADFIIDGAGVFPSMSERVQIKGRGNTSWGISDKKPYRLKFAMPVKPFGLTKGKNWVLLANNQRGSMLSNAVAMKVATMVKTAGANHIVPVELYINGEYRGSYNLTEHVGLHNNSVDIDETNAVLLELDTYYDEMFKFESNSYYLCTNVKSPDLAELPMEQAYYRFNDIKSDFNQFCDMLNYDGDAYDEQIDITMFARFMLVNELVANLELKHPKSTFLYKEDLRALHSKYVFGPVWDFDWAYGYEFDHNYCKVDPNLEYYNKLNGAGGPFFYNLRFNSEKVKRACYKEWKIFMEQHFDELMEYIDDYYAYARPSLENNASMWGDGRSYNTIANDFKRWLKTRAETIYFLMDRYDLDTPLPIEKGDVNLDGAVNVADVVCLKNYLLNIENETFDKHQADANDNGTINVADIVWVIALAMQAEVDATRHIGLPVAEAVVTLPAFTASLGAQTEMPVVLKVGEGNYAAVQFDVVLPEGMTLEDVLLPENWHGYSYEHSALGGQAYRVVVYANQGEVFPAGESTLQLLVQPQQTIGSAERVVSLKCVSLVNAVGEEERMSPKSVRFDMEVTGVESIEGTETVSGGEALHIEALRDGTVKVYTVDGRLVKVCPVVAGQNEIHLPAGVYIVNQQKIVVNN